ncbi:hypothetical protein EAO75_29925, partial [Streptomyces sp. uw30]|uniref:hypothetical protein n=1 Tax=Streptomyces sp. uw30 TaxID=1828179 RepID=UPI0011CE1691
MTTRFDEDDVDGPQFAPDDPLMVILGPPGDRLAPPPGHYETLRRRASRRRLVRTATGVGVTCAVALLVALPFGLSRPDTPTSPARAPVNSATPSGTSAVSTRTR